MTLRKRLGQAIISLGMRLYGDIPMDETAIKPVKRSQHSPTSAVVEATEEPVTWTPEQTGNVIVVEPDIMAQFRKDRQNDNV